MCHRHFYKTFNTIESRFSFRKVYPLGRLEKLFFSFFFMSAQLKCGIFSKLSKANAQTKPASMFWRRAEVNLNLTARPALKYSRHPKECDTSIELGGKKQRSGDSFMQIIVVAFRLNVHEGKEKWNRKCFVARCEDYRGKRFRTKPSDLTLLPVWFTQSRTSASRPLKSCLRWWGILMYATR